MDNSETLHSTCFNGSSQGRDWERAGGWSTHQELEEMGQNKPVLPQTECVYPEQKRLKETLHPSTGTQQGCSWSCLAKETKGSWCDGKNHSGTAKLWNRDPGSLRGLHPWRWNSAGKGPGQSPLLKMALFKQQRDLHRSLPT